MGKYLKKKKNEKKKDWKLIVFIENWQSKTLKNLFAINLGAQASSNNCWSDKSPKTNLNFDYMSQQTSETNYSIIKVPIQTLDVLEMHAQSVYHRKNNTGKLDLGAKQRKKAHQEEKRERGDDTRKVEKIHCGVTTAADKKLKSMKKNIDKKGDEYEKEEKDLDEKESRVGSVFFF
ncbi:hypothetical protein RFI_28979 [Reticulomyxa filosa]|uniref:Uncharacterized protein n=1 Tax=Reticulomyxa filosa TaxID=46433 RepID=X6M373_RETFI|nr:hypothetical protein RFI_28979 [Reticulomyxa filosa]|eukprot:ETO08408.1 hypothetical protein RFI_28979 [Reticulomyxa filosa]